MGVFILKKKLPEIRKLAREESSSGLAVLGFYLGGSRTRGKLAHSDSELMVVVLKTHCHTSQFSVAKDVLLSCTVGPPEPSARSPAHVLIAHLGRAGACKVVAKSWVVQGEVGQSRIKKQLVIRGRVESLNGLISEAVMFVGILSPFPSTAHP